MLGRLRDFFALERNVLVVCVMYVAWVSGAGLWMNVVNKYFESLGASVAVVGLLLSLYMVVKAVSHFIGGSMADIHGRKRVYINSMLVGVIGIGLYFLAPSWIFLIPGIIIMGIGDGVNQTADSILLTESVKKRKRATARATTFGFGIAAGAASFVVGGLIVEQMGVIDGTRFALLVSIFTVLAATVIGQIFLKETMSRPKKNQTLDFHPLAPLRFFSGLPEQVRGLILSRFFSLLAWVVAESMFIFYAIDVIGVSYVEWGILGAASMAFFGFFAFLGGKLSDKYGRKPMIIGTFVCSAAFPVMFMFSTGFYHLLLIQVLMGGVGLGISSIDAYTADHTRKHARGKSIGTADSLFMVSTILGPAVGGLLYSLSPQLPFIAGSLLGAVAIPLAWKMLK